MNRTVSKTVVPPGTVGSNPTLSVLSLPDGLPGVGYRTEVLASGRIWERCESGRIGTPGERVFTMWTVGSNPTLSVKCRGESRTRNEEGGNPFVPQLFSGAVAQLGERQNRNLEVGGSIPLCSIREAGNDMNRRTWHLGIQNVERLRSC